VYVGEMRVNGQETTEWTGTMRKKLLRKFHGDGG
jgi:hypothetical protein